MRKTTETSARPNPPTRCRSPTRPESRLRRTPVPISAKSPKISAVVGIRRIDEQVFSQGRRSACSNHRYPSVLSPGHAARSWRLEFVPAGTSSVSHGGDKSQKRAASPGVFSGCPAISGDLPGMHRTVYHPIEMKPWRKRNGLVPLLSPNASARYSASSSWRSCHFQRQANPSTARSRTQRDAPPTPPHPSSNLPKPAQGRPCDCTADVWAHRIPLAIPPTKNNSIGADQPIRADPSGETAIFHHDGLRCSARIPEFQGGSESMVSQLPPSVRRPGVDESG